VKDDQFLYIVRIPLYEKDERGRCLVISAVRCANPECDQLEVLATLHYADQADVLAMSPAERKASGFVLGPEIAARLVYPETGTYPPLPGSVPEHIRRDYTEAASVAELSPKASATMSRRCLQCMIRDFFGISKRTLWEELQAIQAQLPVELFESLKAMKNVGNAGAHPILADAPEAADVSSLLDVEPHEAEVMLEMVQLLAAKWYETRRKEQETLERIRKAKASGTK
jgi:hypothetical protein